MCKADCACSKVRTIKAHLSKGGIRRASLDGREFLVVPVIMARGDVVMNSTLTPASEFETFAWNGVPVTLRHPQSDAGVFVSANAPDVLEAFAVGRIFNSSVEDGILKAEAWVDIAKADALMPGIVARLEEGGPMDVSTGFFSDQQPARGQLNGREYEAINSNIRPDHLALLPDEVGACSWDDGCGVRANAEGIRMQVQKALAVLAEALGLKGPALVANSSDEEKVKEADGQVNEDGAAGDDEEKQAMTKEEIAAMVSAAVKDAVGSALQAFASQSKAELESALAPVRAMQAQHKAGLVAKITANTAITKEAAEAMDVATLEVVANGIKPAASVADYRGRGFPVAVVNSATDAEIAAAMEPKGLLAHVKASSQKAA